VGELLPAPWSKDDASPGAEAVQGFNWVAWDYELHIALQMSTKIAGEGMPVRVGDVAQNER
jgi:hypothetical protein